jgi:hypothetical protein
MKNTYQDWTENPRRMSNRPHVVYSMPVHDARRGERYTEKWLGLTDAA